MVWDASRPAGSTKIRLSDELLRENNAAIEAALDNDHEFATGGNQTGKHIVAHFLDQGSHPSAPTVTNEVVAYNVSGALYSQDDNGNKAPLVSVPSGTKMLFKQNSAPSGWTFVSEDNDRVLLNTSTEADGGSTGGSWTISGLSETSHTHTLSHKHEQTLMQDENMGANDYFNLGFPFGKGSNRSGTAISTTEATNSVTQSTALTSDADSTTTSSATATINSDGSWRPLSVSVITCQKD